ncbi:hypothetical protein [Actinoallomurus sp. CA-142502]|uniref:hypothetical protein n=1 Tax=Actinoallomurus sp. CA-142502 TaxID=3239885 RepID=UPI003D926287
MRRAGSASWRMRVERWSAPYDVALWFRAAERIQVEAGPAIPGPPIVEPLPHRSTDPADAGELAEAWSAWWRSLVGAEPPTEPVDAARTALSRVVAERWAEAHRWHAARKRAGVASVPRRDVRNGQVVTEIEDRLGRRARPFSLDLVLLPVDDERIRPVGADRYLVPERVYDGPRWPGPLRALVTPIA